MNIFELIKTSNESNGSKQVMSITRDNGEYRSYTYTQMFEAVEIFSKKLEHACVKSGDRIVIVAENSPEWNIAYLSVMKNLCTAVLIDASLPKNEILRLIENADPRCIFTSPKIKEKLDGIISDTIPVLNIMSNGEPFVGHLDKLAPSIKETLDGDSDTAFIIYSSGTTKTATGIMHTHEAMIGTTLAAIKFNQLTSNEKMLVVIPNSHIYGVVTSLLGPLMLGASMHFIESMTGENVVKAFKEFKPTVFSCVPRVFEMFEKQITDKINSKKSTATIFKAFFPICYKLREKTGLNLGKTIFKSIHNGFGGNIRIFCAAGAPLNTSTAQFYYGVGLNLYLNYGLTETNVPIIANNYENYTTNSCGKAYPEVAVKLVKLDDNNTHEIYVKTPFMMKGYFRNAQATTEAFEDGWFKTGDLGLIDSVGNISINGRCKDNIVLSTGKKVTPDDIESAYGTILGVKEFVICGVPAKATSHDEIHAFVVKDSLCDKSSQSVEDAIYNKGTELSQYMKITKIHFIDEIPKTSLQKPKRYLLKNIALEEGSKPKDSIKTQESINGEVNIEKTLMELIRRVTKTEKRLSLDTAIYSEIGLDSLNSIELDLLIEETFGKSIAYSLKPKATIGDLVAAIENPTTNSIKSALNKSILKEKAIIDYLIFKFYSFLAKWVYKVEVKGLENLPADKGYILCPNHQTYFDFLWVTMNLGKNEFQRLGCMAKKEVFTSSHASKLLARICGMIPVDRDNHDTQALALCKQKLKEGWIFLIHPEGTRTKTGEIGEFKKGAAMLAVSENVPIIPVKIKGGFEIYPAGKKLPKLFDFKNMRRCRVEVTFATPLSNYDMGVDHLNTKLRDVIKSL